MAIHRFGLISDTHGNVHRALHPLLEGVEAIFHAGDVGDQSVLDELTVHAPVFAVAGNVDYSTPDLPLLRVEDVAFGKIGIAHGHRHPVEKNARLESLMQTFAPNGVRIILFGHSHQQYLEAHRDCWLVNPGAATRPRFGIPSSICLLEWDSERDLLRFDYQPLDWS